MKKFNLILAFTLFGFVANAQNNAVAIKYPALDPSVMDALYFPINAVKVKKDDVSSPIIKVLYSRPLKKGREIFGVLEQFDKVWRLGANENTEIYFDRHVTIGDKKIKAGKYSLFAIPNKEKWTIIVNKQTDRWGAYSYDETKDVVRIDVPITKLSQVVEVFSMTFVTTDEGVNLAMAWDTTQVMLPILFKK
jgi:hypothetical protein